MNCNEVRRTLSVREHGDLTKDGPIEHHIAICSACAGFLVDLERLEARLAPRNDAIPSDDLKYRIAATLRAEPTPDRTVSVRWLSRLRPSLLWLKENRKMVRRFSFGAVTLSALVILAMAQPSGRATTTLKKMGDAARSVKSIHLIGWNCELRPEITDAVKAGQTQISIVDVMPRRIEAWIKDGRWREAEDFDVTVYESGRVWKNGSLSPHDTRLPLLTSFAYRAITGEDPFGKGVQYTTTALGDSIVDGRAITKLLVESQKPVSPDGTQPIQERRLFWLDATTNLPIRLEEMRYDSDRWALDAVIWFDYNLQISDALFDAATVRSERHTPTDMARHPAKDLYRMTDEQYARYTAILGAPDTEKQRIEADPTLTPQSKDRLLIQHDAQRQAQLRQIMDNDQRRLFDDWWYIQPKILDKLATPEQRAEETKWRGEQQNLMDDWFQTLDPETRRRFGGSPLVGGGNN